MTNTGSAEQECLTCRSLTGEARISPGPPIHTGRYWVIEHAYPCAMRGWLVLILQRHAEALHELTAEEWVEFADLQRRTVTLLRQTTGCKKEYLAAFTDKPGFPHLHIHLVARSPALPDELRGGQIFTQLNVGPAEAVRPTDLAAFCAKLAEAFLGTAEPKKK
ncbi:MAG: HIT family protein [Chloroflexota bacterium]|nr:HIT family protein [Chloroflexota bacterium]